MDNDLFIGNTLSLDLHRQFSHLAKESDSERWRWRWRYSLRSKRRSRAASKNNNNNCFVVEWKKARNDASIVIAFTSLRPRQPLIVRSSRLSTAQNEAPRHLSLSWNYPRFKHPNCPSQEIPATTSSRNNIVCVVF